MQTRRKFLKRAGVAAAAASLPASIFAETAGAASRPVGANVKPTWTGSVYANAAKVKASLLDLGATLVRFGWNTGSLTQDFIAWAATNQIGVLAGVGFAHDPALAAEQIAACPYPIAAVEGPNEPDLNGGTYWQARTAGHQSKLYEAVAGRWPVLSPSAGRKVNEPFLLGLPHDIANIHRYPGNGAPDNLTLPQTSEPLWVTETGYSTYKTWYGSWVVSPSQAATWYPRLYDRLVAQGAERVIIHELLNLYLNWWSYAVQNDNWGVYYYNGSPKPAVAVLRGI